MVIQVFKNKYNLIILFFLFPLVSAQIFELRHVGFGETSKDIIISIYNSGDVPLVRPDMYVDGEFYEKLSFSLPPGKSVGYVVSLEPGVHTIEVRTNNFTASINVTNIIVEAPDTIENSKSGQTKTIIIALIVIIISILIYILLRKPKLI